MRPNKVSKIRWDTYGSGWKQKAKQIAARDGYRCQRCGKYLHNNPNRAINHKKRLADGGLTTDRNLELLCANCHSLEPGHKHLRSMPIQTHKKNPVAYHRRKSYRV